LALLVEEFARLGTEVRFLKGRKAETPEDALLVQFQGMIAEYERAQIAERVDHAISPSLRPPWCWQSRPLLAVWPPALKAEKYLVPGVPTAALLALNSRVEGAEPWSVLFLPPT
jgi:Resolvase, N terminal domain